jgi:hypothetical protein
MTTSDKVTIEVKRGVKVEVREVDHLEGDRVLLATAPKGLKVALQQVDAGAADAAASRITMCG